jgi:hypothetical protein
MKHAKDVVERLMDNTIVTEKVNSYLVVNANVFSPNKIIFTVSV